MWKLSFLVPFLGLAPSQVSAETVSGVAHVIDGDSLRIDGTTIRLFGIDAPEADQMCRKDDVDWSCGTQAGLELAALINGKSVTCDVNDLDVYGRSLAICTVGYLELNRTMVEQGWAIAFKRYSTAYAAAELSAKSARAGIWSSQFDLPEFHRVAKRSAEQEAKSTSKSAASGRTAKSAGLRQRDGSCTIKGNRNRKGQWIYHLPGMPYYEVTRAEEIFCSEAAAQRAGYRRAIVR